MRHVSGCHIAMGHDEVLIERTDGGLQNPAPAAGTNDLPSGYVSDSFLWTLTVLTGSANEKDDG